MEKVLGSGSEGMMMEELKSKLKDREFSQRAVKSAIEKLQDKD